MQTNLQHNELSSVAASSQCTPPQRIVLTVRQFVQRNPAFTELGIRNLIFKASPRLAADGSTVPGNGLIECGALIRIGRKVLLDEAKFFGWVDAQQDGNRQATVVAKPYEPAGGHRPKATAIELAGQR